MRARLVGQHVGRHAAPDEFRQHVGRVARPAPTDSARRRGRRLGDPRQRLVERMRLAVEVPRREALVDARFIDLDREQRRAAHRRRQRLRAAHAAQSRREHESTGERAAEMFARHRAERLVRPLDDSLRTDVDPRAGRHLAVHRQAATLEVAEDVPRRPAADQVAVRDQHARRVRVRAEHARPAFRSARAASHRCRACAACARWRRTPPTTAPPYRCRRTRPDPRAARRRRDRGCSSASAAPLPAAIRGTTASCRAARG